MNTKTGVFANGLIWFGAAVSIAEIEAGMFIGAHWDALILGHLLGGFMLYAAGLLGATTGRNAMETTHATFGRYGMRFFAALNIIQLIGWTAVMIAQGGAAVMVLSGLSSIVWPCVALAVLIGVWIYIAFQDRFRLATVAMAALAVLSVILTCKLAGVEAAPAAADSAEDPGFWAAFELSAAMPLSWLPLISDYTSSAKSPKMSTALSAVVYTLVSIWMYALGMMIAGTGAESVADGIVKSGIGAIGLVVVIFSTVTTTFLDAYSSGESAKSIFPVISPRLVALAVCVIGGVLAVCGVMDRYIDFLYFISSVFAPMAAVLLVDRFLLAAPSVWTNIIAWGVGFAVYRLAAASPVGPTLTSIGASVAAALLFAVAGKVICKGR